MPIFNIFVKMLNQKTITLTVGVNGRVDDIFMAIRRRGTSSNCRFRLLCGGKQLKEASGMLLSDYQLTGTRENFVRNVV